MSIEALILGRLIEAPQSRTSGNTGRPFVTALVRAAVAGDESVFVKAVAFSESAQAALLALNVGDSVALAGSLKPGAWIDKAGDARPNVSVVVAQVLTLYGLKKKREAVADAAAPAAPAQQPAPGADPFTPGDDDAWLRGSDA